MNHHTFKVSEQAEQEIDEAVANFRDVCRLHGVPHYAIAVTEASHEKASNTRCIGLGRKMELNGEQLTPMPSPEMVSALLAVSSHDAVSKGKDMSEANRAYMLILTILVKAMMDNSVSLDWMRE